jgi:hypothetical protein
MGRFLIDIYPISPFTSITIQFDVWILDTCYDNSFMLMILASVYLQLHLYGPIVNKSHQKKEILIET